MRRRSVPNPCRSGEFGVRMQDAGCRVQGAGCRVQGAGCRVQGAGCGVGFNVKGIFDLVRCCAAET